MCLRKDALVAKKYWEKSLVEFVGLVKQVKKIETIEMNGASFQVYPGVFSPIYSSDTAWFAKKIVSLIKNKKFLEIGSGSGIIACLASIHGASQVVATDINPKAVENIHSNTKFHSLNISVREGSVFDPIDKNEKFDVIFWNHPFYCNDIEPLNKDMINASVYDTNYQFLKKFFRDGKNYLAKNGQLILGTSNIARLNLIKKMALDEGYQMTLLEKIEVPIYKGKKVKMDLRVYAFKYID